MNMLSALIYFVGVVDNVGLLALWMIWPGMLGCIACTIAWLCVSGGQLESTPLNEKDKAQFDFLWQWWSKGRNIAVTLALAGWLLYIFVPNRQTLILIAGSEIGSKVVNADSVKSVVDPGLVLVKTWIESETAKLQKPLVTVTPKESK